MLEPTLALQTAVRAALIASPEVLALVPADQIRAGSTRPDRFPTIIIDPGQTVFLGRGSGGQYFARVFADLNVWAIEDTADTARAIGMAMLHVLYDAPCEQAIAAGFRIDEWAKPHTLWMRDPQPERAFTHGVMTIEAVMAWSL